MDASASCRRLVLVLWIAMIVPCAVAPVHQAHAAPESETPLSIGHYTLIGSERVSRTIYEYTYQAQITNAGEDLEDVAASLEVDVAGVTVVDGEIDFGAVSSGATVPSTDYFRVRHDRSAGSLAEEQFQWRLAFEPVGGDVLVENLSLSVSNPLVATADQHGSVQVSCVALDAAGDPVEPQPDVQLHVAGQGVDREGETFTFAEPGEFVIECVAAGQGVSSEETITVLSDAIAPVFSEFSAGLLALGSAMGAVVEADEADDLAGLQAAKEQLQDVVGNVDATSIAQEEPLPVGEDLPSSAELLEAGDEPRDADDAFRATVKAIDELLASMDSFLDQKAPGALSEEDLDYIADQAVALEELAARLPNTGDVSHQAVLDVNDEINRIVSGLIPSTAVAFGEFLVDEIVLTPGITFNDAIHPPARPGVFHRQLVLGSAEDMPRARVLQASIMPQPQVPVLWRAWNFAMERVYVPLMQQTARTLLFLETVELGPFGPDPAVIVEVGGPGLRNVIPGATLSVWGSGFASDLNDNSIELETPLTVFAVPVIDIEDGGGIGDQKLLAGPIPAGLCTCAFGIPDVGAVRVITPDGTSEAIVVNVFPEQ